MLLSCYYGLYSMEQDTAPSTDDSPKDMERSDAIDPSVINRVVTYFSNPDPKTRKRKRRKKVKNVDTFDDYYYV